MESHKSINGDNFGVLEAVFFQIILILFIKVSYFKFITESCPNFALRN